MKPIAIFYHCLFYGGTPPQLLPAAIPIITEQMLALSGTGLLDAASYFLVGINGGSESRPFIDNCIPVEADCVMHGLDCKNENRTILELEKWLPEHKDWHVLYFHSRGATHPLGDGFTGQWRACMMKHNVLNWKQCIQDLDAGYDAVGAHWMEPPATPVSQYIFAGTFWWATSNYLLTLPSIMERERIKMSGIDSHESRYEAEVWIGNGPKRPRVKDYHGPNWNPSKIATCII